MDEIVKICKKHGELKKENLVKIRSGKYKKIYYFCRYCKNMQNRKYKKNNKIKVYLRQKIYRDKNLEKYRQYRNTSFKRSSELLYNSYIKMLLRKESILKSADISNEMVEIKRLQIKIKRKLKEIKNVNKEC